jgi:transposase InsO family protein
LRRDFPLGALLAYVGLPRSTFYYRASHSAVDRHAAVRPLVRSVFGESRGAYGYRRVTLAQERDYGLRIDRKTVAKIMRAEGLRARGRRKSRYNSYRGTVGRVAPNLLERHFTEEVPMCRLVSDITQFNVGDRRVYLSPLIDLYNGEVVSWRIGPGPDVESALGMLADAAGRLQESGAVIHTDQGFQYQTPRWRDRLASLGRTQSMSRKATCLDNAPAESFFGRLKTEFSDGSDYTQPKRFARDLDAWIVWYNTDRIRGPLGGLAPVEYRLADQRLA